MADDELDQLVEKLDLERKVRLLTGATVWRTHAEPDIGLRAMVLSDGPVGVRGEGWDERDTSSALPSPTALAATWDEELVTRLGGLLAAEARRKGVDVLLAPTLNLHRSPLGGRHFECFSEDPMLTGRIGAALVRGIQAGGVAATAKHYVANDSETERLRLNVGVDERTLREVYLAPFEAVVEAGVWAVMSAYNGVNGTPMSRSPLLAEPLKGEWGFDGLVVSDWGAVGDTTTARAALDLAMPGPNEHWEDALVAAVRAEEVPEAAIDDKVRRLLRLAARVGALSFPCAPRPSPSVRARRGGEAEERTLLRRAVAASVVLVRNAGALLPLDPARLHSVAILGPGAVDVRVQGGGSGGVFPRSVVSPLQSVRAALAGRAEVHYAPGARSDETPTPLRLDNARDPRTGEPGVLVRLLDHEGVLLHAEHRRCGRIPEPGRFAGAAVVEIRARLRPAVGGDWRLAVAGLGHLALEVNGRTVLDEDVPKTSDDPIAIHVSPPYRRTVVALTAGEEVELVSRRRLDPGTGLASALAADPPRPDERAELAAAVGLARECDVAIVVVGTTEETETEGRDRTSLDLPGGQDRLVRTVAAANPRTVVIVNSGGPVVMPWREDVPSVLLGWFPGQEAGDGFADVLFGVAEPGGRLPTTWPADQRDVPVIRTTPVDGALSYDEGPHIGYRAWLRASSAPAYWFGHGLGYTSWSYEELSAPDHLEPGRPFPVRVRVRNTGERAGREVVQVYLVRSDRGLSHPVRRLAGYAVVTADPGESVEATVEIPARALEHWTSKTGRWRTEPGTFTVLAGRSAGETSLRAETEVRSAPPPSTLDIVQRTA